MAAPGGCNMVGCPVMSAVQILQLYKEYIDPEFTWSNFTVEEQAKVIVAPRSNNLLDTQRVRPSSLGAECKWYLHQEAALLCTGLWCVGRLLQVSCVPAVNSSVHSR